MSHLGRRPAPDAGPAPGADPFLDRDGYLQQARLLRALHTAEPVEYAGQHRFIHTLTAQQAGGRIAMVVYLAGSATPLDSAEIQLRAREDAQETTEQ